MDSNTIRKLFKTYKCFKGVFPCDQLPYNESLPLNIIVNTDPSYKPGQHWVAVSINRKSGGYYFVSFGLPPIVKEIFKFINTKAILGWVYNKTQIQNIKSSTCGNYSVLFKIARCSNVKPSDFIKKFNQNTKYNDYIMKKVFKNFKFIKSLL